MVNKRAKINKNCFSKALEADSTQSGAILGSNDDLLIEILLRLPVTSVLRFKSVSKHWLSLLSHRRFTLSYDSVPNSPGLFLRNLYISYDVANPTPPPFRSLNFYPDRSGIKIVQSCNGLLLCCSNRRINLPRTYYVFNPTTKQFAIIPPVIGGSYANRTIRFMGLAFHQVNRIHYNIVCLRNVSRYGKIFEIQIYSSDTGKWKILQESTFANDSISFGNYGVNYGVYWNRAVHWIPHGFNMICFKLDVERLQIMPLPERPSWSNGARRHYFGEHGEVRQHYFGESRGHLHLVEDTRDGNFLHLNVYEMLSDYSGWFIKYRVELDVLPSAYPCNVYSSHGASKYQFEVVDVVRGEEDEEFTFIVVRTREKILRYNVVNKSIKQLYDLPSLYQRYCCSDFHRYTQMLSSF